MDNIRRHLLQVHRESIVQDLDVSDIMDGLISSLVMKTDDYSFIIELTKRTDRVAVLLDMLPKYGNEAYQIFVDCLKKDYSWLWEKLQVGETSTVPRDIIKESFEDGLSRGDVPRLPIHYIQRKYLENTITDHLAALKRHDVLVLHGMAGSGKSSLAISALRSDPSLIVNTFHGNVFWINVGDCVSDEQIVALQCRLHRKICTSDFYRDGSNIDISSEMSLNSESTCNDNQRWEDHRDILKSTFEDIHFREALLVIDDLRLSKIAKAFDIGCKIMITTQDTSFIKNFHPTIIKISESLTESESLQLIASCVGLEVMELPQKAKKIHHMCKGAPLLMAMLGGMLADNKEKLKHDKNFWSHFINQFKNKDFFFKIFKNSQGQSQPYLAIEMCINSLEDNEIIKIYKSLAVLPNNVKVSTKALSVIINVPESDVEPLMRQFKNKSLVIEHYSVDLKSYQYEVHDLIMSYLQSIHNNEEMKRLHSSLLIRYKESCLDKSLAFLPDDGYIAYYIGYHILNTQNVDNMWELFHSLYTDIVFIGNKIRLAGPADVIYDFLHDEYSDKIMKKAIVNDFLKVIIKFIHKYGHDLYRYPNTDIIQSILQHNQQGMLAERAQNIVMQGEYKHQLYFQFQGEDNAEDNNYLTLDLQDYICVTKFWKMDFIIVGYAKGHITLWDLGDHKKVKTFHGHKGEIKTIAVNKKSPFKMASTGADGLLKIWNLDDYHEDTGIDDVDSGEQVDHFPTHCDTSESLHTIKHDRGLLCSVCWGHNSDILLAHTNPGSTLVVYHSEGHQLKEIRVGSDFTITCSILSSDDSLVICGHECENYGVKKYGINVYSMTTNDVIMTFTESAPILLLALVPGHVKCILALTTIHLQKHKWNHSTPANLSQARSNITQTKIADIEALQNDYQFQTACVSHDGSYIFISTTDCRILIYSLKTNYLESELDNYRGVIVGIDTKAYWDSEAGASFYHNLITKSGDDVNTVKLWFLQIALESESSKKVKLSSKFDCVFDRRLLYSPVLPDIQYAEYAGTPLRRAETLDSRQAADKQNSDSENSLKNIVQKSTSLDRHTLRPLNLRNGSTCNLEIPFSPLIAVIDKSNKIQILRGKKLISETPIGESAIITVQLAPCGQYLAYGLKSGVVKFFWLKSQKTTKIMDLNDEVSYLEFINKNILIAAGMKSGLMLYEIVNSAPGDCKTKMIILSGTALGSQELINDLNGRRPRRRGSDELSKKSSPASASSSVDHTHRTYPHTETNLKNPPILKCFWLEDIGMMSIASDGSTKIWNLDPHPQLLAVLISRQHNFSVSCVALNKNSTLVLCDYSGLFQIYQLSTKSESGSLSAYLFHSDLVKDCISCCTLSVDGKILAMGLDGGDIVLWHIHSKSLMYTLSLHKTKVRCLRFSPGPVVQSEHAMNSPFSARVFSFPPTANNNGASPPSDKVENNIEETPLVLVSLAGQIAWWNVSYVMMNKVQNKRRSKGGSALHLLSPRSSSMVDFTAFADSDAATSVLKSGLKQNDSSTYFNYPDVQWENLWKGKRFKKNCLQKELLACIKLVGDEANNLVVDDKFSRFVTVDQSGTVYIMNILDNNTSNNNGS